MNPFKDLQKLLVNPSDRSLGNVLQVTESTVSVSVNGKLKILPNTQLLNLVTGDRVSLQGDLVIGKAYTPYSIQTFIV